MGRREEIPPILLLPRIFFESEIPLPLRYVWIIDSIWNLLAAIQPVLYMQKNSVPYIFYRFLASVSLGVAALQFGSEGEISVSVFLYNY